MADIAQCASKMEYQEEVRYPKNPFFTGPEAPCRHVVALRTHPVPPRWRMRLY